MRQIYFLLALLIQRHCSSQSQQEPFKLFTCFRWRNYLLSISILFFFACFKVTWSHRKEKALINKLGSRVRNQFEKSTEQYKVLQELQQPFLHLWIWSIPAFYFDPTPLQRIISYSLLSPEENKGLLWPDP